ncbi:hypothetical protein PVAND_013026 [Polypedilum vanderplanki]|uniref:Clathrin light chain n=1 Tax=Polypedilum vanderplanki TaxID=319348 RepID=A0A9J6CNE6_POLVA|nr:hypothetical protein PVAND_013026 [Polypedilum vanderplanki]
MDFESDPAADFLNREREQLGDIMNDNEIPAAAASNFEGMMSNDDFELINSEIKQADDAMANEIVDDLAGMSFFSSTQPVSEKIVPEKIRIWREETERKLEEKDRQEAEAKEALRVNAQKEMEDWKMKYSEQLEKTKALNRNAEKEFAHSDLNGNSEAKNVWEAISNLCDFTSKTGPKSTKDASRIRQIFLQMKSSPPTKVN